MAKKEIDPMVTDAYIIVTAWNNTGDWIGSFPNAMYYFVETDPEFNLPVIFYSFEEAARYAKEACLISPMIIQIAGKKAINLAKKHAKIIHQMKHLPNLISNDIKDDLPF